VADTSSAYWGPAVATIAVVTSGPTTNTISISTESSAKAPPISSGRSASRYGQRERSTDETGGIATPARNASAASAGGGASIAPAAQTPTSPVE
jgi:hypothetical protein